MALKEDTPFTTSGWSRRSTWSRSKWTEDGRCVQRDPPWMRLTTVAPAAEWRRIADIILTRPNTAPSLAYRLHAKASARRAMRPLTAGNRAWPRGTIVVRVRAPRHPARLDCTSARETRPVGAALGLYETGGLERL